MPGGIDVYRLIVFGELANVSVQTSLYFLGVDALQPNNPPVTAAACLTSWENNIRGSWLACLSANYFCTGASCRQITDDGGPTVRNPYFPPFQGGQIPDAGATAQGPVVTSYAFNGMAGKIRWPSAKVFLPGTPILFLSNGLISSLYLPTVTAFGAKLVAPYVLGPKTFTYCIWQPRDRTFLMPSFWQVSATVGTLRRRSAFRV